MRERTEYQPQRMFEGHRHTSQQQWQWPSFSLSFWVCVWTSEKQKQKNFFPDWYFFLQLEWSEFQTHIYLHKKKQSYLFSMNNFVYFSYLSIFIKMYIFTYYLQQIWHVLICFFPTILHHENVFLVHLPPSPSESTS